MDSPGRLQVRYAIIMLIVDTILYLLIAVYLDAAEHSLFIFKLSFWKHVVSRNKGTGLTMEISFLNSSQPTLEDHAGDLEDASDGIMGNQVIR